MAIISLVASDKARGGIYLDGSPDSDHTSAASELFEGCTVWIEEIWTQPGPDYGFIFHGSAIYLDPWNVLLCAHQLNIGGTIPILVDVGTGNFATNPPARAKIKDLVVHPAWTGGEDQSPDLVVAHLATPLPRPTGSMFPSNRVSALIGSVSEYDNAWGTGYGWWGKNSGPFNAPDGQIRAWTANVRFNDNGTDRWQGPRFFNGDFRDDGGYGLLNGHAQNLDSGGGWYNASGQLVGMTVAGTTGNFSTASTFMHRLWHPDLQNWIYDNLIPGLFMNPGTNGSVRVAWCTNAPGFSLEMNTDLTSTNWVSVTNSPIVVNDLYQVDVSPAQGSCFFRLHSNRPPTASPINPASIAPAMNLAPANPSKTNRAVLL